LTRKNKVFIVFRIKPFIKNAITMLGELIQAYEYETDEKLIKTMKTIISTFSKTHIMKIWNTCWLFQEPEKNLITITVKELQVLLKNALKKIDVLVVKNKYGIHNFDEENITRLGSNCKSPKDWFTMISSHMLEWKSIEWQKLMSALGVTWLSSKHLLWECTHVKNICSLFNDLMNHV
jgi:hypothetical protein